MKPFENINPTRQFAKGYGVLDVIKASLKKKGDFRPELPLPSVRTDLKSFYSEELSVIWFGHSSYLIHCKGINILVDPVFSGFASPVSFMIKAFPFAESYTAADMPRINYLVLTHNHYDHLDIATLRKLLPKVDHWILPMRVINDLRSLGLPTEKFSELNWGDSLRRSDISVSATPARHFSGRGLRRNLSLWTSYVLELGGHKVFIGGDSGYDNHFKVIGEQHGPFDLAMLECGQYDKMWPYIHSTPEEAVRAATELGAKMVLPVHWGKFALANHGWTEPIERFSREADSQGLPYILPKVGEPALIGKYHPLSRWWE